MQVKGIKKLLQLSDELFFHKISLGLNLILENASQLSRDVELLEENWRYNGANILLLFAEEELAKFFILLDAIRCPKSSREQQLAKFYDHLPKGIYPMIYKGIFENFGEIEELVKFLCKKFYLDGPSGADWIFRNWILRQREGAIYVDYVVTDGEDSWVAPTKSFGTDRCNKALVTAHSLKNLGCTNPEALKFIASFWQSITMTSDYHWSALQELNLKMLEELEARSFLINPNPNSYENIVSGWLFPLYQLEMKQSKVEIEELKEIQRNWTA